MSAALQMVLAVEGMFMSFLPPGQLVTSRADCMSMCYRNPGCLSVFYDTSTRQCVQVNAVYGEADMDTPAADMQYLVWDQEIRVCRDGYSLAESVGMCYGLYTSERPWTSAETRCVSDGGHLIKVDSEVKNNFLQQQCDNEVFWDKVWTGGRYRAGGVWEWADNSVYNYTSWKDPDNEPSFGCMFLECGKTDWRATNCDDETQFICETEIETLNECL